MHAAQTIILGANGQLGRALQARFPDAIAVGHAELDIVDWDSVKDYDWSKVQTIINAAAYTNVDGAETAEGRVDAWRINAGAVANLTKIALMHDITLVHVSSEYVFDGSKRLHAEDEPFSPLGVYGQSKAAGDIAASTAPKHYILRTSWVIGDGKNFVRTMIGLAEKNISPTVVADQIGRLTFTDALVDAVEHLLTADAPFGTYNVTNSGEPASWADITRAIFKQLGCDDLAVNDTTTAEYFASKPSVAPRPLQSTMDLRKIEATGLVLRDWRDDLHEYIDNEMKEHA